jgi:predicted 2-oxoglutarate/Fe(II)-dependent dioxygenase YbiX
LDDTKAYRRKTAMSNLDYVELYPKIDVYRNVLENPAQLYEVMNASEKTSEGKYFLNKWDKWAHFGTYTQKKSSAEISEETKTEEMFLKEKKFVEEVEAAYNKVITDYVERHNIELPEGWHFSGGSYSKYHAGIDNLNNKLTMQYHTDHITSQRDMPGEKFFITCTMYINDDYDGGDIEFYIDGQFINHKPKAGDILVFPSTQPYYHGVKTINSNEKFFVRNFIMTPHNGTDEWLANQRKFGAYRWAKMEQERIEHEDKRNMVYFNDGVLVSYEEHIDKQFGGEANLNKDTEYGMK